MVANATRELAEARARTAGPFLNPVVSWWRETVETGQPVGSQDIATAVLPIQIARPLATRSLAASEGAWRSAEASLTTNDAVLEALLAYYEVVASERRVELLEASVANLDEAARVLARREAAGAASGYEETRLSLASELGRSHLAEAKGKRRVSKVRLGALLRLPPESIHVEPALSLVSTRDELVSSEYDPGSREALIEARASQRFAERARARARWAWLPTLELGAGIKHVSDLGGGYGYVLGMAIEIPLFDRGQTLRAEAEGTRVLARARTEALTRTNGAEVQAARAAFVAAREELERFESQTAGQVEALLRAAQSGYLEGERTIVELLDAQRAQIEVGERRLALLTAAKRAEARLRAAAGDF